MDEMRFGVYEHYKGKRYEVIGVARHSETHEDLAIYRELHGEKAFWVRPLKMFTEDIDVHGKKIPRFRFIGTTQEKKKKEIVVAISGGFDPLHIGHVRMIQEAKKLGDKLVVIVNNDKWLLKKKGSVFIQQEERMEILRAVAGVDDVMLTGHGENPVDMSVCAELRALRPDIFANGGDRKAENIPEVALCEQIECDMVFNVGHGGKVQSSSWLLARHAKSASKKES